MSQFENVSKPLLKLRGQYTLNQICQKGIIQHLGNGKVIDILPVSESQAVIIASAGTMLYDFSTKEILWQILSPATCGAIDDDGTCLALAFEAKIHIWDLASGKITKSLIQEDNIIDLAFSPNGFNLATACQDNLVRVYSTQSWEQIRDFGYSTGKLTCICFYPNNSFIAAGYSNTENSFKIPSGETGKLSGYIQVCSIESNEVFTTLEVPITDIHSVRISKIRVSPDKKFLFTDDSTGTSIWYLHEKRISSSLPRARMSFSMDGQLIAIKQGTYIIEIRKAKNNVLVQNINPKVGDLIDLEFLFLWKSNKFVTVTDGAILHVWDIKSAQVEQVMPIFSGGVLQLKYVNEDTVFTASSKQAALWSVQNGNNLWNKEDKSSQVYSWKVLKEFTEPKVSFFPVKKAYEFEYEYLSSDGELIAQLKDEYDSDDKSYHYLSLIYYFTQKPSNYLKLRVNLLQGRRSYSRLNIEAKLLDNKANSLVYSVAGDKDVVIYSWSHGFTTPSRYAKYRGKNSITCFSFSSASKAFAWGEKGGKICFWNDFRSKYSGNNIDTHTEYIKSLQFSNRDNFLIALCENNIVQIWDTKLSKNVGTISVEDEIVDFAMSKNEELIAIACTHKILIYHVSSTAIVYELIGFSGKLDFNKDSSCLGIGGSDGAIRIWKFSNSN